MNPHLCYKARMYNAHIKSWSAAECDGGGDIVVGGAPNSWRYYFGRWAPTGVQCLSGIPKEEPDILLPAPVYSCEYAHERCNP